MTQTFHGFDTAAMFKWSEPAEFPVTREQLSAYARATNDDIPAHLAGDLASPVFNVVPQFKVSAPLTLTMPPEALRMNGLHGEQDFRFHRPMVPGMTLVSRAMPIGIIPHSTGVTITVRSETTADGELVTDQYVTVFIRGADLAPAGSTGSGHAVRGVMADSTAVPPGPIFQLKFQDCSGAAAPIAGEFNCRVLDASDPFSNPLASVTCSASLP